MAAIPIVNTPNGPGQALGQICIDDEWRVLVQHSQPINVDQEHEVGGLANPCIWAVYKYEEIEVET